MSASSLFAAMASGQASGAVDDPLVILFEQRCADEADGGVVVGEDADDLGAALELAVEALDGFCNRYEGSGASLSAAGISSWWRML